MTRFGIDFCDVYRRSVPLRDSDIEVSESDLQIAMRDASYKPSSYTKEKILEIEILQ